MPDGSERISTASSALDAVRQPIQESLAVNQAILDDDALIALICSVAEDLTEVLRKGGKVFLFGNGGSAADAQHLAAELTGRFYLERAALPAEALTVNSSALTAIGNDYGFDTIFSRQLEGLARSGDMAIGLSTSGNSANVVEGLRAATRAGLHTVGLTGASGGLIAEVSEQCIMVPSHDTPRIQEHHILIGHVLCEIAEEAIFGTTSRTGLDGDQGVH